MKYVKGLSQMRRVFIFHVRSWALELNVTTSPATRELASLQTNESKVSQMFLDAKHLYW